MEAKKLGLIQAILALDNTEDLQSMEDAVKEVMESARARQLVIGYRPSGTAVLKQRFLDRLRHTLQDINHGEFISLKDLEHKSADW